MLKALDILRTPTTKADPSLPALWRAHNGDIALLGEGSFGRVFRVKHRGEDVAIKFPRHHNNMLTEVAALASVPPHAREHRAAS